MIDNLRFESVITAYKASFANNWNAEKFKWKAVKCFTDNWDLNAADFPDMLKRSLAETGSLLLSANNFPAGVIEELSVAAPDEVRKMFADLYDENRDPVERIIDFKDRATKLYSRYGKGKNHFQTESSASTYLWLRYPDKYYIYRLKIAKKMAAALGSNYVFKKGAYAEDLRNFYALYNEVREEIKKDSELVSMMRSLLADDLYGDPECNVLTIDFGYFIAGYYSEAENGYGDPIWFPEDYSPDLSVGQWVELLGDPSVFTVQALEIVKRLRDCGGQATCTQLSEKYGENVHFYITGSAALAKRVVRKTNCPVMKRSSDSIRWWTVLYLGKNAPRDAEGCYIWRLRDELAAALEKVDLSGVPLYAAHPETDPCGYWWIVANPKIWSFSDIAVGETQFYTLYNETGNKRRIYQNFLDARAGDMLICYESNPVKKIVAIGQISAEQDGQKIYFRKIEGLASPIDYQALKDCPELAGMECFSNPQGSFFKLTKDEYDFIVDMIRDENPPASVNSAEKYTKDDFLKEVYMTGNRYDKLVSVLRNKKNLILQGAPGVGKTFTARKLAYSMMGEKDDSRIEFVQFHQNYSYEDFMMGYKPTEHGFELKYGVFYRFCRKALNRPDQDFFFIIDEINRGNMSRIFGELLMLIEKSYRGKKITPAYSEEPFAVPENLYIIGMMNTADRSLALIDYALRRRFGFFEIEPGFDSEGFRRYQDSLESETFDRLTDKIIELNRAITNDKALGRGFRIGHSYLCGKNKDEYTDEWLREVVEFDILPQLSEYWFDDNEEVSHWESVLLGVFQ